MVIRTSLTQFAREVQSHSQGALVTHMYVTASKREDASMCQIQQVPNIKLLSADNDLNTSVFEDLDMFESRPSDLS